MPSVRVQTFTVGVREEQGDHPHHLSPDHLHLRLSDHEALELLAELARKLSSKSDWCITLCGKVTSDEVESW